MANFLILAPLEHCLLEPIAIPSLYSTHNFENLEKKEPQMPFSVAGKLMQMRLRTAIFNKFPNLSSDFILIL